MRRALLSTFVILSLLVASSLFAAPASEAAEEATCDCWYRILQQNFLKEYPIDHVAPVGGVFPPAGQVVKFGGKVFLSYMLDETRVFDGKNWNVVPMPPDPATSPKVPPKRAQGMAAYDKKRKKLIMVGGFIDANATMGWKFRFDTWEWDGNEWYFPPESNSIFAGAVDPDLAMKGLTGTAADVPGLDMVAMRAGIWDASLVYDEAREQIVLYGGTSADAGSGGMVPNDQTWALKDGVWSKLNPTTSPPARTMSGAAYDPARERIIVQGGTNIVQGSLPPLTETPGTPEYVVAKNNQNKQYVDAILTDTWSWDGTNWTQLHPQNYPEKRTTPGMSDGYQDTPIALFGGQGTILFDIDGDGILDLINGTLDDFYTWNGSDFIKTVTHSEDPLRKGSAGRNQMIMRYDPAREYVLIAGGYSLSGGEESTSTWTWQPPFGLPLLARQYFAEGFTGLPDAPFQEYITLINQSKFQTYVRVRYLTESGAVIDNDFLVGGQSRYTINVNAALGPGVAHGTVIYSDKPVFAERPMYFDMRGKKGGHVDPGAEDLHKEFFFGEGYTGPGFDSFLTMLNTNSWGVNVDIEYLFNGGGSTVKQKFIPPNSRLTVTVRDDIGDREFSARIKAHNGFIHVEEPIYFDWFGIRDGSINKGQTELSATAEFAEGYTGAGFQEYITIGNPGTAPGTINFQFFPESGGGVVNFSDGILPKERKTYDINAILGPGVAHSTRITSDIPLATARPMYFVYGGPGGWDGGHVGVGFTRSRWALLPEGYANGPTFHPYLTVGNPWGTPTEITAAYVFEDGTSLNDVVTIPANTRFTRNVLDLFDGRSFSVFVLATDPNKSVLVERPQYFNYYGWAGGSVGAGFNGSPPAGG